MKPEYGYISKFIKRMLKTMADIDLQLNLNLFHVKRFLPFIDGIALGQFGEPRLMAVSNAVIRSAFHVG